MLKREKRQIEIIKESLTEYVTQVFASIGTFHLRENTPRFKEDINCIIISPLINNIRLENLSEEFNIEINERDICG